MVNHLESLDLLHMSKPKEEEDFEFDESVSSNLSFLNDEEPRDNNNNKQQN